MNKVRTSQITSRVKNDALRQAAAACLDVADRFNARATAIKTDPSFTEIGRQKTLKDDAAKNYLPGLKAAYAPIARALADAKSRRAALAIPAPDPTNIAAALERQEIRAMVRGMSPNERFAFVTGTADERIADAILSAPGCLSGLMDVQFGQLRDLVVDRRFGGQIAEIREAEETAEAAQAAMLVARNDIKAAIGLDGKAFDDFEKKAVPTPWLLNEGQKIVKVIPGQGAYPAATADEIALGKFYANTAEYLADNPGIQITQPAAAA
ncbi:hypothetical protein EN868_11670 [Mesorhizobium sp. M2D.F.Ca.ET.225.01.1.1]|uniref:hypothetical protein n=1 Tax=unclassified Mesorhizobium TaxID=325217 RepID=UPI000FD37422|nr:MULTISPECIES: hypothetical protein [unclassified Mesorhizobium]TGP55774.1 hypothetical protein EN869_025480 [Mesorhizobium sp. M2D.F.Ca.ET.226.01.1.1]TGP68232.1 hypothetical protein EN868_11670 [Mesorhizobium sp. M2D.F.Ca.ET.225.01.1.1]